MQGSEEKALGQYIESLAALAEIGVPGADEQSRIYKELVRLASTTPYDEKNSSLSLMTDSGAWHSSGALGEILQVAQTAFLYRDSPGELVDALDDFIRAVRIAGHQSLPEARLLLRTAERWLRILQSETRGEPLLLEMSLSLALDRTEEDLAKGESVRPNLPLALTNRNPRQIEDVWIYLLPQPGLELSVNDSEPDLASPRQLRKRIPGVLRGEERHLFSIPYSYRGHGALKVWADYTGQGDQTPRVASNVLEIKLLDATSEPSASQVSNPYIPDLPLLSESQWKNLAQGGHRSLLTELLADNSLRSGRVLVIRGCRRTGKTSLLRRLLENLERRGEFLPVYVDVYLWYLELAAKVEAVSRESLYFEFANAVLDAAEACMEDTHPGLEIAAQPDGLEPLRAKLESHAEVLALPAEEFNEFLLLAERTVRRKVLLIVDELDWWLQRSLFGGSAETLLADLTAFARRSQACSVILSHDWTSRGWDPKYESGRLTFLSRRLRFLNRQEVLALTSVAEGVQFSGLAVDLVWRLSGGWPGLAQLLCYEVIEHLRRARSLAVDVSIVKAAAQDILQVRDYGKFLSYLLGSLTESEVGILQWWATSDLIQTESSEILGLRYSPASGYKLEMPPSLAIPIEYRDEVGRLVSGLEEKEILLKEGSRVFLRVGLLSNALAYSNSPWR